MFKKFLVSFLAFALVSVQANAATHQGLKAAFDELNYSLSVEWDQQDRGFYNAQMKKFMDQVELMQQQGLSNEELVAFGVANIKDAKLAQEIRAALQVVQVARLSAAEGRELLLDTVKESYRQGASWSGDAVFTGVAVILLIVIVVAAANAEPCVENCPEPTADDYYDDYDPWYWD